MTAEIAEPTLLFNWRPPRSRKVLDSAFHRSFRAASRGLLLRFPNYLSDGRGSSSAAGPGVRSSRPDSEQGRTLLRWIEAEDPALASAPQRPPESRRRSPPRTPHIPSYVAEQPQLKHMPLPEVQVRAPEVDPTRADSFQAAAFAAIR